MADDDMDAHCQDAGRICYQAHRPLNRLDYPAVNLMLAGIAATASHTAHEPKPQDTGQGDQEWQPSAKAGRIPCLPPEYLRTNLPLKMTHGGISLTALAGLKVLRSSAGNTVIAECLVRESPIRENTAGPHALIKLRASSGKNALIIVPGRFYRGVAYDAQMEQWHPKELATERRKGTENQIATGAQRTNRPNYQLLRYSSMRSISSCLL